MANSGYTASAILGSCGRSYPKAVPADVLWTGQSDLYGGQGRNRTTLNRIAKAANQGGKLSGPEREDVLAMLRVAEGLRDHVKALLKASQASWHLGHAGDGWK